MAILARQYGNCNGYGYSYYGSNCSYSGWNSYGRWIFLAAVILFALFVFFLFSCLTARRRRRLGYQPYRGTAWTLGRTPPGHGAAQYNPQPNNSSAQPYYNNSNNPPPAYQTENSGYYGGARDTELQSPPAAYKPPQGPPPGRV